MQRYLLATTEAWRAVWRGGKGPENRIYRNKNLNLSTNPLNRNDTLLNGVFDQIGGGMKLKFLHQIIFVPLDCSYGDAQDVGDFFG
jgi:hypothetical protein